MKNSKLAYSILAALILAGIAWAWIAMISSQQSTEESHKTKHEPVATLYEKDIYFVTLDDGTRCAVISGLSSAGIDCDWQTNNKETNR